MRSWVREKSGECHEFQEQRVRLQWWSWCCWLKWRGWKGVLCGGTRKTELVGRVGGPHGRKGGTNHDDL